MVARMAASDEDPPAAVVVISSVEPGQIIKVRQTL